MMLQWHAVAINIKAMKILVVHRQKDTVDVIKSVLSEKKPVVLQTESGLDGLLTSRIEYFDLIICGTDLPVVTGFELIRSIRTNSLNRDTPVVLLTDQPNEKMQALAHALNVVALIATVDIVNQLAKIVQQRVKVSAHRSLVETTPRGATN